MGNEPDDPSSIPTGRHRSLCSCTERPLRAPGPSTRLQTGEWGEGLGREQPISLLAKEGVLMLAMRIAWLCHILRELAVESVAGKDSFHELKVYLCFYALGLPKRGPVAFLIESWVEDSKQNKEMFFLLERTHVPHKGHGKQRQGPMLAPCTVVLSPKPTSTLCIFSYRPSHLHDCRCSLFSAFFPHA